MYSFLYLSREPFLPRFIGENFRGLGIYESGRHATETRKEWGERLGTFLQGQSFDVLFYTRVL